MPVEATALSSVVQEVYTKAVSDFSKPTYQGFTEYYEQGLYFLVADAEAEGTIDLSIVRKALLSRVGGEPNDRVVQVIGDSGAAFQYHDKVLKILLEVVRQPQVVLEYGFTGSEHDTNCIVSRYLNLARERGKKPRVIGNLVGQSIETLNTRDWYGSTNVDTFTLLYRKDGELSSYGSDTWLTDGIQAAEHEDSIVCFEGGPQAFHQCVNALLHGIEVYAHTGFRPSTSKKFSAAQMLGLLSEGNGDKHVCADGYLQEHPPKSAQAVNMIHKDITRLITSSAHHLIHLYQH